MPDSTPPAFARAVVFGACGFLGRVVVRQLAASGARVLGIDTRPWPEALPGGYSHSASGTAALPQAATFLGDGPAQGPAGQGRQHPAAFFHLAGLADAGACQKDPALAQKLNVDLVAEALAALARTPCAFVFPSTGIVYGDGLGRPAREDDPLLPTAEYARGKIAAEGLVRAACAAGPLCGAIARLSNLYGPGGGENTVLGRILAQARRGEALQVWDESPVRDFLFVSDAAEGLLRLGLAALGPANSEGCLVANLSTGLGTRVGALLDLGAELFHTSRLPQEREAAAGAPVSSLVLDNSRLAALTRWRPAVGLAQGLAFCL
ncbi:MAG: NAD(P)-dependent oxidoreductase [Proteobacteria bacterium]|nr:NAD(P)-dependent oxidoreductase [Pseudomonadota bacterium]